jgi:hypothetical protein
VLKDRSAFYVAGNSQNTIISWITINPLQHLEVQKPKLMFHALKGIDVEVCSKP